ncbi:MAG: aconitase X swivel domain-containing protein [Roseiarcus sp.]
MIRRGRFCARGEAQAPALVLCEPLSFWGGVEVETGRIVDRFHPGHGWSLAGQTLVMPCGRGSSSSASVLAETIRRGVGPAGVILARPDPILTVGSIVAQSLYNLYCPIVVCSIDGIATGVRVRISARSGDNEDVAIVDVMVGSDLDP